LKTILGALTIITLSIFMLAGIGYAADSNTVSVTAVVISRGNCTFRPPRNATATLDFGNLDPANPIDKNATATLILRCQAQGNDLITYYISDDAGLYETGPNAPRMKHTTQATEYLPYSFIVDPRSETVNKTYERTLTITGTVRGVNYQDARLGSYTDTVVVSIVP